MKRIFSRYIICLLLVLLIPAACFGDGISGAARNSQAHITAVVLPADDGYQSLSEEKEISIQEIIDIFVAASEEKGDTILLQGATSNNNPSSLRYRTGIDKSIKWDTLPKKGNADTFHSTLYGLDQKDYDHYDQIVVISGHLGTSIKDMNRKFNSLVPTYLFQTMELDEKNGKALLDHYGKIAKLNIQDLTEEENRFYANATKEEKNGIAEIHLHCCEDDGADTLINTMLEEAVFDGALPVQSDTFKIPASLVDQLFLMVTGDNLEDLKLISPDGSKYAVTTGSTAKDNELASRDLSLSGKEVKLVSLKAVMTSGEWKIEGADGSTARLYYTIKQDVDPLIKQAGIIDSQIDQTTINKGTHSFTVVDNPIIKDLFALYPSLRMRVTDTVNDAGTDITAQEGTPDRVDLKLSVGGDHLLTFRLEDDQDHEIVTQGLHIKVLDNPPVFNRENGEEIIVYSDSLDGPEWKESVEGWFSDPDYEPVQVTKIGDDAGRVSLVEGKTLKMSLDEDTLDGSEDVILRAKADAEEITASVRIVWRSLKKQIDSVRLTTSIEPEEDGLPLAKRTKVRVRAQMDYAGPDQDRVVQEMKDCEAVLTDRDGNEVATASFDEAKREFLTDPFELPGESGQYTWTLCLRQEENKKPGWSLEKKTDKVKTDNHAPVSHPEILTDDLFNEQYVFDAADWNFMIPEGLITDPDNDPIDYEIRIEGDHEAKPVRFNSSGRAEPVTLPDFGEYTITILGKDNEGIEAEPISRKVTLINLKESLENIKGTLTAEPEEEQYRKKDEIILTLALNTKEWTERGTEVFTEWLGGCLKEAVVDNTALTDIKVSYDAEKQSFSAKIAVPDKKKTYSYQILLKNQEDDREQPEITVKASAPCEIPVKNGAPEYIEDSGFGDTDVWVMKAEEYKDYQIPDGIFQDPDDDGIQYTLKLSQLNKANKEEREEETGEETETITLPHSINFEPFGFFELTREYEAVITASDGDDGTADITVSIRLSNQLLLFIIIGAAAVLLLIIIAIILYARYRKNLPEFKGKFCFVRNGQYVSPDIDLAPWKKQKHLPLTTFAGSISILLDNGQWEAIRKLELRPSKTEGLLLYQVKAKKDSPEEMPRDLTGGLSIRKR